MQIISLQKLGCADAASGWRSRITRVTKVLTLLSFVVFHNLVQAGQSVALAWDPSPDPSVVGYNTHYGRASGIYTNKVDSGNTTTGTVFGLTEGGTYFFVATAYDSSGVESVFSNEINYTVPMPNMLPTITLNSPLSGGSYLAPASINLAASVTANGHTITKVQFYNNTTLLGEDTSTPYSLNWSAAAAGNYSLTVRAVYDAGSIVASSPASMTVTKPAPTVALISPINGASYLAPATISLATSVTGNGNVIAKVQFYNGATLLGEDSTSPYSFTWSNVSAGSLSLTAWVVYGAGSPVGSTAATVAVTIPVGGAETAYVTGAALGTPRNDYSGYVGMNIVVGAHPITVTALGRIMAGGNSRTHTVKLVNASSGADVAGGAATIAMNGGTLGQFQYGNLSSPVVLAAGTAYYVVSQETVGGDAWYGWDTTVTTTAAARNNALVWGADSGPWLTYAVTNQTYGPLDFKYTSAPPETAYVTGAALGTPRNDYSGYVGMNIVVGAHPITVTALGRIMAGGNSRTHTVKLVNASSGADVAGGAATIAMNGDTLGQFQYGNLSSPVVLAAGTAYYVVSQETVGGDAWYGWDTTVTTTAAARNNALVWGADSGPWQTYAVTNQTYGPLDFKYTSAPPPETAYVTGAALGTPRNDYSGYVGMNIVVGAHPITVTALGRIMAGGNSRTHTVKLVNASSGADVAGGAATIAMNGGTLGQFQYGNLSSPVVLAAGTAYYVVSQETVGGDVWYGWDTTVTTTAAARNNALVWGADSGPWLTYAVTNQTYGPLDFKYTSAPPGTH